MSHGQRVSIYGITGIEHGRATNLPVIDPSGKLVYLDAPEKYASLLEMEPSVAPTGESREAGYVVVGNVQSFHHRGDYARLYKAPGTHAVPFPYRRYSPWLPKLCGGESSGALPTSARRAYELGLSDAEIVTAFLRGFRRDADKVLKPSWSYLSTGDVLESLTDVGFAGAALLMLRGESFADFGKELSQEKKQETIATKERDLQRAQEKASRLEAKISEAKKEVAALQPQFLEEQNRVAAAAQAVEGAQTDLETKQAAQETALQRQKDLAEQEADEPALTSALRDLNAAKEDVATAEEALKEAQSERNSAKEKEERLAAQIAKGRETLENLAAKLQNEKAAQEEAQGDLDRLQNELSAPTGASIFMDEKFKVFSSAHVSLLTDGKTGPESAEPFEIRHGRPKYVGRDIFKVHIELSEPFFQLAASLALDVVGRDVEDIKIESSAAAMQQKLAVKEGLDFLRGGIVDDERALVRVGAEVVARFASSRGAYTTAVDAASYENKFITTQSLNTKTALMKLESRILKLQKDGMRVDELVQVPKE